MQYLIVGCGYLGRRVARKLVDRGHGVHALTRSSETAEKFRTEGLQPIVGDVLQPDSLQLPRVDRVIYAVGYDRSSAADKRTVYVDGLANVMAALGPEVPLLYVSSTSVYGQADGEWVDERSETVPRSDGGQICLDAEKLLQTSGRSQVIVRLGGIYGPDRVLRKRDALQSNAPIAGNPDAFLNLIHVDDAADGILQICALDDPPPLLLLTDGHPVTRREYYGRLNALLELPEPQFDAEAASRHGSGGLNKRCRNRFFVEQTGYRFAFENFESGLRAAFR